MEERPESNRAVFGGARNSRWSKEGAGWDCSGPAGFASLLSRCDHRSGHSFSWLNPRPLWDSRNEVIARVLGDPTNERRRRWIAHLGRDRDPVVDGFGDAHSFVLMGDTGEGDASGCGSAGLRALIHRGSHSAKISSRGSSRC